MLLSHSIIETTNYEADNHHSEPWRSWPSGRSTTGRKERSAVRLSGSYGGAKNNGPLKQQAWTGSRHIPIQAVPGAQKDPPALFQPNPTNCRLQLLAAMGDTLKKQTQENQDGGVRKRPVRAASHNNIETTNYRTNNDHMEPWKSWPSGSSATGRKERTLRLSRICSHQVQSPTQQTADFNSSHRKKSTETE
uniref:Uncharacterized protein n=1 Tax=Myotis myotis TaxID=51298 RepID=A0A7J7UPK6_MYOMY|nr:hypothetical protein mMyoMyo1_008634 [Myotis myotis]